MAATPKPVRKIVKKGAIETKKQVKIAKSERPHVFEYTGMKGKSIKDFQKENKQRIKIHHTNLSTKMKKFYKKHPGEAYEE